MAESCVIEVVPEKDFITYGIGMPLMQMRRPEKARGRISVAPDKHPRDASTDHPLDAPSGYRAIAKARA